MSFDFIVNRNQGFHRADGVSRPAGMAAPSTGITAYQIMSNMVSFFNDVNFVTNNGKKAVPRDEFLSCSMREDREEVVTSLGRGLDEIEEEFLNPYSNIMNKK